MGRPGESKVRTSSASRWRDMAGRGDDGDEQGTLEATDGGYMADTTRERRWLCPNSGCVGEDAHARPERPARAPKRARRRATGDGAAWAPRGRSSPLASCSKKTHGDGDQLL